MFQSCCGSDPSFFLFSVKETFGGEDAPRSYQQLHRPAQVSAGEGVPQPRSKRQAGEGRHPGYDGQLPEAAGWAGAEPEGL